MATKRSRGRRGEALLALGRFLFGPGLVLLLAAAFWPLARDELARRKLEAWLRVDLPLLASDVRSLEFCESSSDRAARPRCVLYARARVDGAQVASFEESLRWREASRHEHESAYGHQLSPGQWSAPTGPSLPWWKVTEDERRTVFLRYQPGVLTYHHSAPFIYVQLTTSEPL